MRRDMQFICPVCGQITGYHDNPFRPFCSRDCKNKDFLKWVDGAYRIPAQPHEEDNGERETDD